jgi:hypothetical protein
MNILKYSIWALLLISLNSVACDICGNAGARNSFDLLPQIKRNYIGLKYEQRLFYSKHIPSRFAENLVSTDFFQTIDLNGRYFVNRNLQILGNLPFQYLHKKEGETTFTNYGFGDASVNGVYSFQLTKNEDKKIQHSILAGLGIKLPTGRFDLDKIPNPNIQIGSGSFDLLINSMYVLKFGNSVFSAFVSNTLNTANKYGYKFGNRLFTGVRYSKGITLKENMLYIGGMYQSEIHAMDLDNGSVNPYSGGYIHFGGLNADYTTKKGVIGLSFSKPFAQNLADRLINQQYKLTLNIIKFI